jgi:hypothetical protein
VGFCVPSIRKAVLVSIVPALLPASTFADANFKMRVVPETSPKEAWAALAPLLAGQPRMRVSRDGGKPYPQRHERDLSAGLPSFHAAVRTFGKDGTCAAVFLDFDSSVAGVDLVNADVAAVKVWLGRCGARWIEDFSPNGGRHVYIPLQQRVVFSEARDLVEARGTRYQSLTKGYIRVLGSMRRRYEGNCI